MHYTYVLKSFKDCLHYVGFTHNLKERFRKHQAGKVQSTKSRRPLSLEYYEAFAVEELARIQEKFYKTGQGRRILRKN
ncbi:MAG: GIY-YIG nuclease family protein [Patescibacteria group bacterium]